MSKQADHAKCTPQKNTSRSHKKKLMEEALAKDLFSPFRDSLSLALLPAFTPLRKQPEYLLSPSPVKRDLFTQLLGTETKQYSPLESNYSIEEESMSFEMSEESQSQESMEGQSGDNEGQWSDENGIKKRKRKSTAQIKLLKQELDGEMNWTKQKIVRMADITGLSQSQVYKWCWDQKKKQNKSRDDHCARDHLERRKLIRKNFNYRSGLPYGGENVYDGKFPQKEEAYSLRRESQTKVKSAGVFEAEMNTEKKVNKRLVFN